MHILLVEDNNLVAELLETALIDQNFTVDRVANAKDAKHLLMVSEFDVVILDRGLPDADGLTVLQSLRDKNVKMNDVNQHVPVLILTANDAVNERVKGLQTGADDYVTKPFEMKELIARLHALVRRASGRATQTLKVGDIELTPDLGLVKKAGETVILSRREFALLEKLMNANGAILSADQLKDGLYGLTTDVESNALNVHIHNLRRKLGKQVIKTVRGVGYRLGDV